MHSYIEPDIHRQIGSWKRFSITAEVRRHALINVTSELNELTLLVSVISRILRQIEVFVLGENCGLSDLHPGLLPLRTRRFESVLVAEAIIGRSSAFIYFLVDSESVSIFILSAWLEGVEVVVVLAITQSTNNTQYYGFP